MGIGTSVYSGVNTRNKWEDELNDIYQQINNREKFNYNQNNDALYKQYAQQYQQNAKLAMEDTVGQVSALTGGYANSYAATAGQAMYNQQMSGLNDKALEIYQLALQQYNDEGDRLMGIYNMTASNYGLEQNRIDSEVAQAQWAAEFAESQRQFNANLAYEKERATASDAQWAAELAAQNDRHYASISAENGRYYAGLSYDKQRAKASDEQYATDLAYKYAALEADKAYNDAKLAEDKRQFDLSLAEDQRQFNEKQKKSATGDPKPKVMSKTEYERTVNALPNDLRRYLTYGAVKTDSDATRYNRGTALETSVAQGDISKETAEKLLTYWGYDY